MSNKIRYVFIGIIGFIVIFLAVAIPFSIIKVRINEIGVWVKVWSVKRGVVPSDFGVGWQRRIPRIDEWERYDATVQTLSRTGEEIVRGRKVEANQIRLRSADDYDLALEIVVKHKLMRGKVYRLRQELGAGERYKQILENEAVDVSRAVFGKMVELDLYNPREKRRRAEEAKELLTQRMKPRHVEIVDVLLLDLRFDPKLERKIKNLKVAELDSILNVSKAKAADQRGITQTIDADTEAIAEKITGDRGAKLTVLEARTNERITEILAAADKYLIEKKAAADRYREEKIAAGQLLIRISTAEGESLRRQAMIGEGGNLIVAMEAARNINFGNVDVSTQQIDLLDIEGMTNKLGGTAAK